jgi:hypothetical protein
VSRPPDNGVTREPSRLKIKQDADPDEIKRLAENLRKRIAQGVI